MQEGNKAKRGNDRLVPFSTAKSSQGVLAVRATPSRRVQEARSHTLALALGALRGSGGLLEFRWNADHQTKRDGADISASCRSFASFGIANLMSALPCRKEESHGPELAKRMQGHECTATNAEWGKDRPVAFFNVKSSRHRCAPTVLEVNASRTFPRFKSAFVFVGQLPDICGSSPDTQYVAESGGLQQLGQSSADPPSPSAFPHHRYQLCANCSRTHAGMEREHDYL